MQNADKPEGSFWDTEGIEAPEGGVVDLRFLRVDDTDLIEHQPLLREVLRRMGTKNWWLLNKTANTTWGGVPVKVKKIACM